MTISRPALLVFAALGLTPFAHAQYVEVTPPASSVTSSTNDGNVPGNTVDNSLATRWSGNGDGAWLKLDLGSNRLVGHVTLGVHQGNTRKNKFDLQVSTNNSTWTTVWTGQSSGTTTAQQTYDFTDVTARWVRYLGHGYVTNGGTSGTWNSLLEADVYAAVTPTPTPTPTPTRTPTPGATATPTPTPTPSGGRTVYVTNASQLTAALADARAGDTIVMAATTYAGRFVATANGTSASPITLQGPVTAVLDGGSNGTGYGFHLNGADYWRLVGFTVRNSKKGIVLDNAVRCALDTLTVRDIGEEAVHFRTFSSDNTIQNSTITNTGLVTPGFGEGVYIGSAESNWGTYTGGQPDRCDRNQVLNNHIGPNVRAETIDVKEGTTGGLVQGNTLDATGLSGANFADSWMDMKGNDYVIAGNHGINPGGNTQIKDGFQTHIKVSIWGNDNRFSGNTADVRGPGYGFWIDPQTSNTVCNDNTVTNAGSGYANVAAVACP